MKPETECIQCPDCEGKGKVEVDFWSGWQFDGKIEECPTCHGRGEIEQKPEEKGDEE